MKTCPRCKISKVEPEFYKNLAKKDGFSGWCKACSSTNSRDRNRALTPEQRRTRRLMVSFGLTPDSWLLLASKQGGACAICKTVPTGKKGLCVDHNHTSKAIRGLLCSQCNVAVGMLKESVVTAQALIEYLKSHSE